MLRSDNTWLSDVRGRRWRIRTRGEEREDFACQQILALLIQNRSNRSPSRHMQEHRLELWSRRTARCEQLSRRHPANQLIHQLAQRRWEQGEFIHQKLGVQHQSGNHLEVVAGQDPLRRARSEDRGSNGLGQGLEEIMGQRCVGVLNHEPTTGYPK